MWNFIILILLFFRIYSAFDLPHKCISDLKINNDRYNISEIYQVGDDRPSVTVYPTDAHFDVYGNLFYVETKHENGSTGEGYRFNINFIKSGTTNPQKIPGLPQGLSYSIAIDKKLTKVYFGTESGMYEYNYGTHTASPVSNNTSKLDIFVDKNSNRYIIENTNGLNEFYILDGDKKILCHSLEALNEMAIDEKSNFYFIREEKLFILKSTQTNPTSIGNVTYHGMAQIAFYNNIVFVASEKLAYFHENDTGNLKVVDNIPGKVTAIAFDKTGNFVLGTEGKILKYKKNECYIRKSRIIDDYEYNIKS